MSITPNVQLLNGRRSTCIMYIYLHKKQRIIEFSLADIRDKYTLVRTMCAYKYIQTAWCCSFVQFFRRSDPDTIEKETTNNLNVSCEIIIDLLVMTEKDVLILSEVTTQAIIIILNGKMEWMQALRIHHTKSNKLTTSSNVSLKTITLSWYDSVKIMFLY